MQKSIDFEPVPEWLIDVFSQQVEETLSRLHIPITLAGFRYHTYAVSQVVQNPTRIDFITKELYPEIAKQYDTTAINVERAMRTAVLRCWDDGGRKTLDEMAGHHLTKRPANRAFIATVAAYIRHRP